MKDLGPTLKGRLQEFGSLLMQGHRPAEDSFLTGKIRQAGLNIMGRTTTPEFGVCSSAENSLHVTRNPWDTAYTTYGSSAGTGAIVAAGVLPMSHATDGGGSIRIPAGANGNIGLKVSRGVFSLAPGLSDLSGLVSIQGCHSRTVRDTAAFVDQCRGGAPGEFMPFWSPAEPYSELIKKDPGRLRIALSHEWGDYRAVPHFVAELERVGRFLEGLGHHVEWALPKVDFQTAFAAQTTCYISNFAQVIAGQIARLGYERPPADLLEPINIKIWEAGLDTTYGERSKMQAVFNTTSRAFGGVGHHPHAGDRAAHAQGRHHRVPHGQRQPVRLRLVRQPVEELRVHPARQPVRHARHLAAAGGAGERSAAGHPGAGAPGQRWVAAATGCADRTCHWGKVECRVAAWGACDVRLNTLRGRALGSGRRGALLRSCPPACGLLLDLTAQYTPPT